jgi:hypothetical protein
MALSITNRGIFTHNSAALTFTCSPTSNFVAGSTAAIFVSADNASSGGATNDINSVTDTLNNTWTRQTNAAVVFDNGAASAGVQGAWFTTEMNGGTILTSTVVTVTLGSSTTAKTGTFTQIAPAAGKVARCVTAGAKAAGATGTAATSGATGTINVGQAVLVGICIEAGTTQTCTGDSDTTNGSWSTLQYAEIGSTTSGNCSATQGKVQTTANSTQTYDVTLGISSDYHASWVVFSELTVYTPLTADPGSHTITGTAATPKASRLATASAGSYALTGTDAAPKASRLVTAGAGSYAVTGTDATLTYNESSGYTIAADAGSVALSGTAAALAVTRAVIASSGSVAITGTAATPRASRVIAASSGSAALTGTAASLSRVIVMAASSGTTAVTGTAASFRRSLALSTSAGSTSITGTSAALRFQHSLSAASGACAITGTNATLTYTPGGQYSIACGAGLFAVSGATASLLYARVASAVAGSLAVSGVAASLTLTIAATPEPRPRKHARSFSTYQRSARFAGPRRIRRQ